MMIDINEIKDNATALGMWEYYLGRRASNGRFKCPFNLAESNHNISVKNNSWHCFSCGEGGDIIKLVQKMYQLSFKNAIYKICQDFGLSDILAPTEIDLKHIEEKRRIRDLKRAEQKAFEEDKTKEFQKLVNSEKVLSELIDKISLNDQNYICYSYSDEIDIVWELIRIRERITALLDFLVCRTATRDASNGFIFDLLGEDCTTKKEIHNNAIDKLYKMLIKGDFDIYG